jgi:magnesium chelatase family protein
VGDPRRVCSCDYRERLRYTKKISGPLLDRIDLHVSVPPVSWADIQKSAPEETSEAIKQMVAQARRLAIARFPGRPEFRNADLAPGDFERFLCLDGAVRRVAAKAVERLSLSVRALHRALRVARTIADLEGNERVTAAHLAEAISYRPRLSAEEANRLDSATLAPVRSSARPG